MGVKYSLFENNTAAKSKIKWVEQEGKRKTICYFSIYAREIAVDQPIRLIPVSRYLTMPPTAW